MEVNKPVLHTGIYKYPVGNVNYDSNFLKKLADSDQSINIELNDHFGQSIAKSKALNFKGDTLFATIDIPDEHIVTDKEVSFSTHIIPSKYDKVDTNTFNILDGSLENIVYINDGSKPRDERTITFLLNKEKEGEDDNMAGDTALAEENGRLKAKIETLEKEKGLDATKIGDLETEVATLKQTVSDKTDEITAKDTEITNANGKLKTYVDAEEATKKELVLAMVKDDKDPLYEKYMKMDVETLNLIKGAAKPSTPGKGVGSNSANDGSNDGDSKDNEKPDENGNKTYDYTKAAAAMDIE